MQAILSVVMETTAVRPFPFSTVSLKACFPSGATGGSQGPAAALGCQWQALGSPQSTASVSRAGQLQDGAFSTSNPFPATSPHPPGKASDKTQNPRESVHLLRIWARRKERGFFHFPALLDPITNANPHCTFFSHIFHPSGSHTQPSQACNYL